MKPSPYALVVALCLWGVACGPGPRAEELGGDGGEVVSCPSNASCTENTPALCSDGIDNDHNGLTDCQDPSCSGIGNCPVCGMVQHPQGMPFMLPDGVDDGNACHTNADCTNPEQPNCIDGLIDGVDSPTCAASYTSTVQFTGFAPSQTFTQVADIQSICVNMEHSYLGDLEIEMLAPSGEDLQLQQFQGEGATPQIYLGIPVDDDSKPNVPGTGWNYCWTPTATNAPMVMYAEANGIAGTNKSLPAGNYQASKPWTALIGATLNGGWTLRITDRWPSDNGFVFSWNIAFDPNALQNCNGQVIQ